MTLWQDSNFRKYFFYLYTKSTAVVTPVLYLLLVNQLRLEISEILKIAALYSVLSIVLEIPTGVLTDFVGPRKTSLFAMVLLAFSFTTLLLFQGALGFHLFMLLSTLSASFFSGSDQSLLRSLLTEDKYEEYRKWSYQSNGMMYLYTSPLLLIGVYLYEKSANLLIFTQILFISFGFISLFRMTETKSTQLVFVPVRKRIKNLFQGIVVVLGQWRFLGMTLLTASFASIVLINHKTIQAQLTEFSGASPLYVIAIAYLIGNVISWRASGFFQKLSTQKINSKIILLALTLLGASALILLTLSGLTAAFLGFFLMCAFKSAYRPLVSSEFVKMCPDSSATATLFSAVAFFSSLINAGIHMATSKSFLLVTEGNQLLLLIFLTFAAIGLTLVFLNKRCQVKCLGKSALNEKYNSIHLVEEDLRFVQKYPADGFSYTEELFKKAGPDFPYPAPRLLDVVSSKARVEWEYIPGTSLDKFAGMHTQKKILNFLQNWKPACVPITVISYEPPAEFRRQLYDSRFIGIIHGDLNPTNVLCHSEGLLAVDWDLMRGGYFWYDLLSLVAHPSTPLLTNERVESIQHFLPELGSEEVKRLIADFSEYKVEQLQPWALELKNTIEGFRSLSLSLRSFS